MRIAFVNQPWDFTIPEVGGYSSISLVSYQLAIRLADLGHDVISYGKKGNDQPWQELDTKGILHVRVTSKLDDVIRKPFRLLERLGISRNPTRPLFASYIHSFGYALQIALDLSRRKPDIVHVHNFSQLIPIIRAFNRNAKFVVHMQCEWLTQIDQKVIEKRLRHISMVVGCSEYITDKVRQRFPQYSNNCQTFYNGVDLSKFIQNDVRSFADPTPHKILFVGRVSPEKGVHVLLDAFGIVEKTFPDIHLQIVGGIGSAPFEFMVGISDDKRVRDLEQFYDGYNSKPDYYYNQLLTRLPENQMKKVSFLGNVPNTQIQEVYRDAHIYVNSSLSEALGIPILEAMAMGVPVIGAEVGGVPDLIRHEETGLLFKAGDPQSLAEAIIRLLEDENIRKRLAERALNESKERYSWDHIVDGLNKKYQTLLNA